MLSLCGAEDWGETGPGLLPPGPCRAPGVVRRPQLPCCLPTRLSFLLGKIHPGKAILQHDRERSSRTEEGSFGCEPTSSAGSQGSTAPFTTHCHLKPCHYVPDPAGIYCTAPSCKIWMKRVLKLDTFHTRSSSYRELPFRSLLGRLRWGGGYEHVHVNKEAFCLPTFHSPEQLIQSPAARGLITQ